MTKNSYNKYDKDFKKLLVSLHQNGKTPFWLCKEYIVSHQPNSRKNIEFLGSKKTAYHA